MRGPAAAGFSGMNEYSSATAAVAPLVKIGLLRAGYLPFSR